MATRERAIKYPITYPISAQYAGVVGQGSLKGMAEELDALMAINARSIRPPRRKSPTPNAMKSFMDYKSFPILSAIVKYIEANQGCTCGDIKAGVTTKDTTPSHRIISRCLQRLRMKKLIYIKGGVGAYKYYVD